MPVVPYKPYPDQQAQPIGVGGVRVQTPSEAFGANVGRAIEHLGEVGQRASNELFNRAVALQEVNNETEANEGKAKFIMEAGKLHGEYMASLGTNAPKSLDAHIADLNNLRTSIRDGLSNSSVRRKYDAESLGFMARNVFSASGHAASEGKKAAVNAARAVTDSITDNVVSNHDDKATEEEIRAITKSVNNEADISGWSDEERQHKIAKAISTKLSRKIEDIAKDDPWKARELLEDYKAKGRIQGPEYNHAKNVVRSQFHTITPRNISDPVNAGFAPYMKQVDADKAQGVEETLMRVVKTAQRRAYNAGIYFTIGDNGDGNSRSISLIPTDEHGKPVPVTPDAMKKIDEYMKQASGLTGIPLGPGKGTWRLKDGYDTSTAPPMVEEPLADRTRRAVEYARRVAPEDSIFHDLVRERVDRDYNHTKREIAERDRDNWNTVLDGLVGRAGKKLPTTVEELRSDPKVAAAYDGLTPAHKLQVQKKLTEIAKGDYPDTPETRDRYFALRGMAESNPKGFVEHDLAQEKLPIKYLQNLRMLQEHKTKNASQDPRVAHALGVLKQDIAAIDLTNKDPNWNMFVGLLHDGIKVFTEDNKRPPKDEDLRVIFNRVVKQVSTPSWADKVPPWVPGQWFFSGPGKERFHEGKVPPEKINEIKKDPRFEGNEPTDEQIRRIYLRDVYKKLYQSKTPPSP